MKGQSFLNIFHLGPGSVGKKFIEYLFENKTDLEKKYGHNIRYVASVTSRGCRINLEGMSLKEATLNDPGKTDATLEDGNRLLAGLKSNAILVDTTASDAVLPFYEKALAGGGWVVTSNKKIITSSQGAYNKLFTTGRIMYETAVGAGLPIISTIQEILDTGDEILEISGCFSGTLGYIFSELEKGKKFSEVIHLAKENGFTEPDPRDDLSGLDVARKALILSRLLGAKLELETIKVESLYPKVLQKVSVDDFLNLISKEDEKFVKKMNNARKNGFTYRYVATVTRSQTKVGLKKVLAQSDIGSLRGPDNIAVIKTRRYYNNPMIIKGPGAGVEVTAAGVLGDVVKILKRI